MLNDLPLEETISISKASHGVASVVHATPLSRKRVGKVSRRLWVQALGPLNQGRLRCIARL